MFRTVSIFCLLSLAYCQYPRQRAPHVQQGPPPPREQPMHEDDDYRPRSRPDVLRPASVHYVNIGAELAGDYKFGYDTGRGDDGQSFREETRLPDGTVQGAYGYVDETGKQRIVKYTAGKDGFNIVKDDKEENAARAAPSRPAQQPAQQAYRPPPVARAPPAAAYAPPQPVYRPEPSPQRAYAPQPQAYAPQPRPQVQHAPAPQAYAPQPRPQTQYAPQAHAPRPRHQSPAPRPQRAQEPAQRPRYSEPEYDYDYPDNDITERRIVPIDTTLFNYNIGTSQDRRK